MTECERLVNEGRIPEDFFKEETRSEFFVDLQRKKIWAVELDMLNELDRVCKKHNLKYFMWSGTLLGAVRHQGFIPWDDDIDVAMLREDYDKLKKLSYEFEFPYFLQYPHTDPEAGYNHLKIRNSNTTAFNMLWSFRQYNYGIYIDIFPIDNLHMEDQIERQKRIEELNIDNSLYMKIPSPYINDWDRYRIPQYSGRSVLENYDEIERLATMYKDSPSEYGIRATGHGNIDKLIWPYEFFAETVDIPFEGRMIPAPKEWEKYLQKAFGEYMIFPPKEKRVNKHSHTIFDPDTPYLEYEIPPYAPYTYYLEYGRKKVQQIQSNDYEQSLLIKGV